MAGYLYVNQVTSQPISQLLYVDSNPNTGSNVSYNSITATNATITNAVISNLTGTNSWFNTLNAATGIFGGGNAIGVGYEPYGGAGGFATLSINGALGATAIGTEHLISNNWAGQNVMAIQNNATGNAMSVIRYRNATGFERCALGHGNTSPGNVATPFQAANFWESSSVVNADGTITFGTPDPMRFIMSGAISAGGVSSNFFNRVMEVESGCSVAMFPMDGSNDYRNQNATFRFDAFGLLGLGHSGLNVGADFACAQLDVWGNAVFGASGTSRTNRVADAAVAPICSISPQANPGLLRMVRDNVGKVDINYSTGPYNKMLTFIDTDNSSVNPLSFTLDGTHNVGVGGLVPLAGFGGTSGSLWIANASATGASSPVGGGILYCVGGALVFKGSSGTTTTIANA